MSDRFTTKVILAFIAASSISCALVGQQPAAPASKPAAPSTQQPPPPPSSPQSFLMRFADIHRDRIVFTYEGDLWIVWSAGGDAIRLTNSPGEERSAKFSPDGDMIAFTGSYDGGTDVYVMNATGGVPKRLTYHPAADDVIDWMPDGKHVLFRSRREYPFRVDKLYTVSIDGGMPEKLPVDQAGLGAISPDGKQIVYDRITREMATWKRHQGGTAQDLWLGSFDQRDYHRITDWPGTDNYPMWWDDAIYFTSDRKFGTMNLYKMDVATGETTALTQYKDYDVKFPSIGYTQIVYQYGEQLYVYDIAKSASRPVPIRVKSDSVLVRDSYVSATDHTGSFRGSPDGKQLLLETRGQIIRVPTEPGRAVNLTETSAARAKSAIWSPDGKSALLISDRSGEEEFYLADPFNPQAEWKQVTHSGKGYRMQPVFAPDGKRFAFSDKTMNLTIVDIESMNEAHVDRGEYDDGWERWGIQDYVWSPDSKWLAYTRMEENGNEKIYLYSLDSGRSTPISTGMTEDFSPSFAPDGKYLYFLSHRAFSPIMDRIDQNHIFLDVCRPVMVVLSSEGVSPFAPKETTPGAEPAKDAAGDSKAPVRIDLAGIERRVVAIPGISAGNYFRLEATTDGFLYLSRGEPVFTKYQYVTDATGDSLTLNQYKLADRKAEKIMDGIANYHVCADGKKLAYHAGATFGIVDVGHKGAVGDGKVDLSGLKIKVNRADEFKQIFAEAWRVQRDWFYDANMHGENWPALRDKYGKFVPYCGDRSDLNYLIGEMIGELNVGHTYIQGGEMPDRGPRVGTGLLGVDFESPPSAGYHRIVHIIPSTPGDDAETSSLDQPGCPIHEGHYLIAIDGHDVPSSDDVCKYLENKAGAIVELTFNDKPSRDGARKCLVKTIGSENAIRYREWVENNRRKVDELSGGKVGYVHIPDMGEGGLIEFAKAFYPQHTKQGMIIDDRYNTGGFTGDMIIDRLERKLWAMQQAREGNLMRNPERAFYGHYVLLINDGTGSNGEYFAEAIKRDKLATVVGTRTWGGAVGIEPHQDFVDGGQTTPPQFAPFGLDGQWLIEGHGVDPDVVVDNLPADVLAGKDAQLERGVAVLLQKIANEPKVIPKTPAYPVKTKPKD